MIFRRLRTEGFINLPDRWWEFWPGLQLVRGPNEAGKTALRRALTLAIFQDAATTDKKVRAMRKWGAGGVKLQLEFEHAGTLYRIERDFEEGKNLLETPDSATHLRNKEKIREQLRQMLPIPDEAAFRASACMAQDELRIEEPGRIHDLIEQRVISAGDVNVADLVGELRAAIRERHKGETRAAQRPGIFRDIEDKLAALQQQSEAARRELEQCEHAASELKACERELAAAQQQLKTLKERQRRHKLFHEASKEQESKARELLRIEEGIGQAQKLDNEIAGLQQQLSGREGPLKTLGQEVENAGQLVRLQEELTAATQEAEHLQTQADAVGRLQQRIEALRAEMEQLPVRKDEAENAFHHLPGEIVRLEKALDQDRAAQQSRQNDLATSEQGLGEIERQLAALTSERGPLESARDRAGACAAAGKQLMDCNQELRTSGDLLQQLQTIEQELQKASAQARSLSEDRFRQLRADIEAYRNALSGERMAIGGEGAAPIRVRVDGQEEVTVASGQEVCFQRRAQMTIGGTARVTVENRNQAAAQLEQAEAELAKLLRDSSCETPEQFEAAVEDAANVRQQQVELEARRSALLAGRRTDDVERRIAELTPVAAGLQRRVEELAVTPAQACEVAERLTQLDGQERELHKQEAGVRSRIATLRSVPAESASMRQNQEELQRKKGILADILRRAGVEQPPGLRALIDTISRIDRDRAAADTELARVLGGARADDVCRLLKRAREKAQQLKIRQDAIALPTWLLTELEQKKQDLRDAQGRYDNFCKEKHIAEALRQKLDVVALKQQHETAAIDVVAAKQQKEQYEQYRMDSEEALNVEEQIHELEAKLPALNQEIGTCRTKAEREEGLGERLTELEEQAEWWKRKGEVARARDAADRDVQQLLELARDQAVAELRSRLPVVTRDYLAAATCGRHAQVQGEGLVTCIYSSEKGAALEAYELSSGTADQLYLAIRLAALRAMFGNTLPPLLLDDVLVRCDPARRAALLRLLTDFAVGGQAILFTCQDYPEYVGLPCIDIGTAAAAG